MESRIAKYGAKSVEWRIVEAMRFPARPTALAVFGLMFPPGLLAAGEEDAYSASYASIVPYTGRSEPGVDTSTLDLKVMCGYQGWFTTPTDGARRNWQHYAGKSGKFEPGSAAIEIWPDVTELTPEERFATPFVDPQGKPFEVYSAHRADTVARHFKWMKDYGIDGVFVQRFATMAEMGRSNYDELRHANQVLVNCRAGANEHGRAYALMYDLTGVRDEHLERLMRDWKELRTRMKLGIDPADKGYLHHNGKPVVGIWGIGFDADNHRLSLAAQEKFMLFIKQNPEWGGCSLVIGTPTHWRKQEDDSLKDPKLHEVLKHADIISPWTVGRYRDLKELERHGRLLWRPDQVWCEENHLAYMPVVFPGFSWRNLAQLNPAAAKRAEAQIPRFGGKFLWKQFMEAKTCGARMIYVAMFDEMDEGTAIFKCTNTPPAHDPPFLTMEGMASDTYLWLTGQGAKLIREEMPVR